METLAFNIPAASKAAGVGLTAIKTALRLGELPFRKNGTRRLILATDLRAWVEALPIGTNRDTRLRGGNGKFVAPKAKAVSRRNTKRRAHR